MKEQIIWFLAVIGSCCILSCCTNQKPANELLQAGSLMQAHPDSALNVLENVPAPEKMSKSDYAYYCLLLTEARDKTYYKFTSDSIIRIALNYYEAKEGHDRLPKAYYLAGRVYQTLRDSPQAISYYLKARDALPPKTDYALEARIYNMLGNLYLLLRFNENAIQAYQKAHNLFSMDRDSVNLPYTLRNIARTYDASEKRDSAILYYDRAISLAAEVKNQNAEQSSRAELMSVLLREGNLLKAEEHKGKVLGLYGTEKKTPQFLLILGDYYNQIGKPDSARYYFNQSLDTDNIYTHAASIRELALLEEKEQNYKKMAFYYHQYIANKDSIEKIKNKNAVSDMEHFYNYQQVENENNRLKIEYSRKQLFSFMMLFSLALLFALFIIFFLYSKQKHRRKLWAKERDLLYKEEEARKSRKKIEENLKEIQLLKYALEMSNDSLDQASKELLLAKKELLEQENKGIEIAIHRTDLQRAKLIESAVYKRIKKMPSNKAMSSDIWDRLKSEMDTIYYGFDNKLRKLYPSMSDMEIKICYLLKAGFSVSEIAALLSHAKSSISSSRKRLYEKISGMPGGAEDLDQII